ncbi:hypothetical protein JCM5350_001157 [Sporobolomyces pararoseus]
MASRGGGRGGGRGGRGGGRGGGASGKPQPPIGNLAWADIISTSKEGTDIMYPSMEAPDTAEPDERERKIAARYNRMIGERKFSAFWIDAPTRASTDIERWSDRFKPKTASAAQAAIRLQQVHQARQYDRDLHPPAVFDAVMEKKRKNKASEGQRKRQVKTGLLEGDDDAAPDLDASDDDSQAEEDALDDVDDEDEEGDNDYEAEYFDNGEGDDYDDLGGGGGGGDGDDGGIMD